MTLAEFLKHNGIKKIDFAERIGVSPAMITQLCQRKCDPSFKVARKILKITGGVIGLDELAKKEAEA